MLVAGLRPFVQLSDSLAGLFDLPTRLQERYRSFRRAGQLVAAPLRVPFRVGVQRFLPIVWVAGRALEPEFYSVLIQDRKIKLYGLLRLDKRVKVVHTYALHDDDRHVTMRTTVANLKESGASIALRAGARLELRGMRPLVGKPLRPDISTVSWVGWVGDGLCVAWVGRGYRLIPRQIDAQRGMIAIERGFELKPGEEITYDHSLHIDSDCSRLRRTVTRRAGRPGGLFIRQS